MRINAGMAAYKAPVPPVKPIKSPAEEAKVQAPARQDEVVLSGKAKGLSADALEKIQEQQNASFNEMIKGMVGKQTYSAESMNKAQGFLFKAGMGKLTPEQAAHNVSEEGPYGVNAVASSLVDMAVALSGGDPEKFEMLRGAVEDGFKAAGVDLGLGDEMSDLPQVSQDTFTEVMKRFDHYEKNGSMDGYEYKSYADSDVDTDVDTEK